MNNEGITLYRTQQNMKNMGDLLGNTLKGAGEQLGI